MASRISITEKKPMWGNKRSFSMHATRKKYALNIQKKRIYVPEEDRFYTVKVTVQEIHTIDKIGLAAFLARQGRTLKSLD